MYIIFTELNANINAEKNESSRLQKKKKSFVKINSIVDQLETVRYTAGVYCVQLYSTMM